MSTGFFGDIQKIKYEGPDSTNPLAFRFYNPDEIVAGKRMEDHLRFAVAYWHTFTWPGGDPFGGQTFQRPWFDDSMEAANAAFAGPAGQAARQHTPTFADSANAMRFFVEPLEAHS